MSRSARFDRWRLPAVLAAMALVVGACTAAPGEVRPGAGSTGGGNGSGDAGEVVMISSQLVPTEEQETMRNEILGDFGGTVEFIGAEPGVRRLTRQSGLDRWATRWPRLGAHARSLDARRPPDVDPRARHR